MSTLHLLDYSTANAIYNFTEYFIMFSTMSLCMNILRFYFYNFVSDNKNDKIRDLKDQVENLHNILEEVVRFLNRKPETYDEEKAEFVNTDEAEKDVEPESEEEQKPTNEAKED